MSAACEFGSIDQANEILGLMMRHWNAIAGCCSRMKVYLPIPCGSGKKKCCGGATVN
jgi:hypothetical protein